MLSKLPWPDKLMNWWKLITINSKPKTKELFFKVLRSFPFLPVKRSWFPYKVHHKVMSTLYWSTQVAAQLNSNLFSKVWRTLLRRHQIYRQALDYAPFIDISTLFRISIISKGYCLALWSHDQHPARACAVHQRISAAARHQASVACHHLFLERRNRQSFSCLAQCPNEQQCCLESVQKKIKRQSFECKLYCKEIVWFNKAKRNCLGNRSCDKHLKLNYLRLLELLVIICFQFNKWTKYILILVCILIPKHTGKLY